MLEVTPTNVDKIFKLPLREAKTVFLTNAPNICAQSVDVDYQPIERCTGHKNGTISCWTQLMEAVFDLAAKVLKYE